MDRKSGRALLSGRPLLDVDLGVRATILIVDDDAINRKKLSLAIKKLGHRADAVDGGEAAMHALRTASYDAVLLDIVMPVMDGFEVLGEFKADERLRDIPVIVVSALDDERASVVKAIGLGAEDFLPKDFDPIVLKARLGASLTRKQYRAQELEYLRRVDRLTEAAEILEGGRFSPQNLKLDALAAHDDSLGRLAAVFRGMALEIYDRELRLKRTVHLLRGSFLVIAVGLIWGLTPALSRMSAGLGSNPLGLAVWVNAIAASFCLCVAAWRRSLPRLTRREWLFFLCWALIAGILQRLTTFWVAAHVEATMLSLIVTLQGFMVFAFAAITKLERTTPRRLLGLTVGLAGVALVLLTRFDISNASENRWLLFAVALMLLPIAYASGALMALGPVPGKLELLVILMGIVGASSLLLAFHLIATAGAVFYSQGAYAMTLAGIVWGMLLLDEELSVIAWAAFAVILIGMYLVEPKPSGDEVVINRSFTLSKGRSTGRAIRGS